MPIGPAEILPMDLIRLFLPVEKFLDARDLRGIGAPAASEDKPVLLILVFFPNTLGLRIRLLLIRHILQGLA